MYSALRSGVRIASILSVVILAGCGGSQNNLTNPVSSALTECTSTTCVTGQIIGDSVVRLNYSCAGITALTDVSGFFACPVGSTARFYLQKYHGNAKIILGDYKILDRNSQYNDSVLRISVLDLVSGGGDLSDITNEGVGYQVRNILRFLYALDTDGDISDAPSSNRIVLSDIDREGIDKAFSQDIPASTFAAASFDSQMKPYFDAIGKKLTTDNSVIDSYVERLKRSIYVVNAGAYEASPMLTGLTVDVGMLGSSIGESDKKAVEGLVFLQDRDNKMIAVGQEWLAKVSSATTTNSDGVLAGTTIIPYSTAISNTLVSARADSPFGLNGYIKNDYNIQTIDSNGNATGSIALTRGRLTSGTLFTESAISAYRAALGLPTTEAISSLDVFGLWERRDVNGNTVYRGAANLNKWRRNLDTYLDPTIWKTKATASVGERVIFPLSFTMSFLDARNQTPCANGCYVGAGDGKTNGKIGMTILENGNIVSDVDNDCSPIDPLTLKDQDDTQEYRLGVIGTAVKSDNVIYITPNVLIPKIPGWEAYYSLYFGFPTSLNGSFARISLAGLDNNDLSISPVSASSTDTSATIIGWVKYRAAYDAFPKVAQDNQPFLAAVGTFGSIELQDQTKDACKIKTKS